MIKPTLQFTALLALAGCVTYHSSGDGVVRARIGETAALPNGATITPLRVEEDSRCPAGVQCVWAGQVRLTVRIERGGTDTRELIAGKPVAVAGGTLELAEVAPTKRQGVPLFLEDYRFGFSFTR